MSNFALLLQPRIVAASSNGIAISASPSSASAVQSSTTSCTVTLVRTAYTGTVSLAVSGLPSGVTAAFTPSTLIGGTLASTLAFTLASGATVGTTTITITASGSGVAPSSISFALTVTSSVAASIALNAAPSSATAPQSGGTSSIVTLTRTAYTGTVTLAATGLPTGVTAAFTPATLSGVTLTSMMTLSIGSGVALATSSITVTASGSGVSNATATFLLSVVPPSDLLQLGPAELPRVIPSAPSTNTFGTGTVFNPSDAGALATLLASGSVVPGCVIRLTDGVNYGAPQWPVIAGASFSSPVWVVTSNPSRLPAPGRRVDLSHRLSTSHLRSTVNNQPCLQIQPKANGWRFVGVQMDAGSTTSMYGLAHLGPVVYGNWNSTETFQPGTLIGYGVQYICKATSHNNVPDEAGSLYWEVFTLAHLPDGIVLDRCDISLGYDNAGEATSPTTLKMECKTCVVTGCYIYCDSQVEGKAVGAVNAAGPFLIENNTIIGNSENFIFGGAKPNFDTQPTDVTIRRNWFYKPLTWNPRDASWDHRSRRIKNIFELKVGSRVDIRENVFENCWDGGLSQYYAIVIKISTGADYGEGTGYTNAVTADVTFRYNVLKNVSGIYGIGARDTYGGGTVGVVDRVSIFHTYTLGKNGNLSNDGARSWQISIENIIGAVHIENNTLFGDPRVDIRSMVSQNGTPSNLTVRNHIGDFGGNYGGFTLLSFAGLGKTAIDLSLMHGPIYLADPANNHASLGGDYSLPFIRTSDYSMVRDYAGGDWRAATSLAGTGYGGRTPGCDIDTVNSLTTGCASGVWS